MSEEKFGRYGITRRQRTIWRAHGCRQAAVNGLYDRRGRPCWGKK